MVRHGCMSQHIFQNTVYEQVVREGVSVPTLIYNINFVLLLI